jgi:hypothetical protein
MLGLALGASAWLAAGRQDVLASPQDRLAALQPARSAQAGGGAAPMLAGAPLFALSTGPNAVKDPAVMVLGLSRMPGRTAALVAIDGKSAAWLARGESRDGVILREVGSGRATFDLPLGLKDLRIGEVALDPASAIAAAPGSSAPGPAASDIPPPGYRGPPPPASAPGFGG